MSNTLPLSWPSADYISGTRSSHFSTQCIHSEEKMMPCSLVMNTMAMTRLCES